MARPSRASASTGSLGARNLADGVGVDAAVVLGGLEDAVEQRSAGHHRVVADLDAQFVLPAAYDSDGDGAEVSLAKEGQ